jgi:hypothetical protein
MPGRKIRMAQGDGTINQPDLYFRSAAAAPHQGGKLDQIQGIHDPAFLISILVTRRRASSLFSVPVLSRIRRVFSIFHRNRPTAASDASGLASYCSAADTPDPADAEPSGQKLKVVVGLSGGRIPWPVGQRGRAKALVLCGALAKGVRLEAAVAVAYWWGVSARL